METHIRQRGGRRTWSRGQHAAAILEQPTATESQLMRAYYSDDLPLRSSQPFQMCHIDSLGINNQCFCCFCGCSNAWVAHWPSPFPNERRLDCCYCYCLASLLYHRTLNLLEVLGSCQFLYSRAESSFVFGRELRHPGLEGGGTHRTEELARRSRRSVERGRYIKRT